MKHSKPPEIGRTSNSAEVAAILGISARTLGSYRQRGMPHTKTKAGCLYDLTEIAAWRRARNLNGKQDHPNGDGCAWTIEDERNDLMRCAGMWMGRAFDARAALASAASSLAPRLVGLDAGEIESVIAAKAENIIGMLTPPKRPAELPKDKGGKIS